MKKQAVQYNLITVGLWTAAVVFAGLAWLRVAVMPPSQPAVVPVVAANTGFSIHAAPDVAPKAGSRGELYGDLVKDLGLSEDVASRFFYYWQNGDEMAIRYLLDDKQYQRYCRFMNEMPCWRLVYEFEQVLRQDKQGLTADQRNRLKGIIEGANSQATGHDITTTGSVRLRGKEVDSNIEQQLQKMLGVTRCAYSLILWQSQPELSPDQYARYVRFLEDRMRRKEREAEVALNFAKEKLPLGVGDRLMEDKDVLVAVPDVD
jgi:hypothetical protein